MGLSRFITSNSFLYSIKSISMVQWYNICTIISKCGIMNCSVICSPGTMGLSLLQHIATCILAIFVSLHLSSFRVTFYSSVFSPVAHLSIHPSTRPSIHSSVCLLNTCRAFIIIVVVLC